MTTERNDKDRCTYVTGICDVVRETHDRRGPFGLTHPFNKPPKATGDVDGLWNQQKCSSCGVEAIDFIVTCAFCQQAPTSTGLEALETLLDAAQHVIDDFDNTPEWNTEHSSLKMLGDAMTSWNWKVAQDKIDADAPTTEQPAMCSAEGIAAAHPACEPADAPTTEPVRCDHWVKGFSNCYRKKGEPGEPDWCLHHRDDFRYGVFQPTTDGGEGK